MFEKKKHPKPHHIKHPKKPKHKHHPQPPVEVRRNIVTCTLYADPHVQGFSRKFYDAQTEGDWVLYRGRHLSAHYRGRRFGAWVGPVKFGVKLKRNRIYTTGFKLERLELNGKIINIKNGIRKNKRRKNH